MKKILLSIFMAAGICLTIAAQQTVNDINAEKRAIGSFHGIEVGTGVELFLTAGNTEEIAVSASKPEFREKLITRVENGILKIYYESKTGSVNKTKENKNLKAYVSYKTLDLLDATTGAAIKVSGTLSSSSLEMKANTGATVEGEMNITKLVVTQSTGSKISLSGKADNLVVEGSTGSKFTGEDMQTGSCNATVSTGAKVSVSAEKELQAKASTGGSIKYKGGAALKEIKRSTGGSVSKI